MNSLLYLGSQVCTVSKSYYGKHLSDVPLKPKDMTLKMRAAGGGTVNYYGQIT